MNGKKAKQLRRQAKENLFNWYLTIIEDGSELTPKLAVQYTPRVKYYHKEESQTIYVSQYTQRWFILEEKKSYGLR
jgi:uncharacterized protein YqjF (DUF2071 family)